MNNKLHIKIKPALIGNGYTLIVGNVRIVTSRRYLQDVYNNLLTRPLVESLALYASANKGRSSSSIHLKNYLSGYTVVINDTQLLY